MTPKRPNADTGLAIENYPELNRQFYAARPWTYLRQRMRNVLVVAGARDELHRIFENGLKVGMLQTKITPDPDPEVAARDRAALEDDQERFVITETEVLLHHASETLLRLYLAHESIPPCPWLTLARTHGFAEFKRQVKRRFLGDLSQEERRERVIPIFHGTTEREKLRPSLSEEDWHASADNIESFLVHFAGVFLEAGTYNAAKHGLAVNSGESALELSGIPELSKSGPAIDYLAKRKTDDGRTRWAIHTKWIDVERTVGFIYMATSLIEALWGIAAWRYTDKRPEKMPFFPRPRYEDLRSKEPIQFGTMMFDLLYYEAA